MSILDISNIKAQTGTDDGRGTDDRHRADTDEPGEFTCPDCGRRCTRGPSGTEYGHAKSNTSGHGQGTCPRRPADKIDETKPYHTRDNPQTARDEDGKFAPAQKP